MVKVKPLIKNRVPRVVMKEGIRSTTVISPLTRPISAAGQDPRTIAGTKGNARLVRVIHHKGRQRIDLANRQVYFSANQDHHLARGDDRGRGRIFREVSNIAC